MKFKRDELFASDAPLLGRVTYEGFAKAWPDRTDEAGFADRFNGLPKYVVSSSLRTAEWNNTHIISDNVAAEVSKLKQEPGQDILVNGSGVLVQSLLEYGMVDELRLLVYPVVLGAGKKLFKDGTKANLKLASTEPFKTGVVLLTYQLGKLVAGSQ